MTGPNPSAPHGDPTSPPSSPAEQPPARPPDVDTGFWLWVVALPLMTAGHLIDLLAGPGRQHGLLLAVSVLFVVLLVAVVSTFVVLMRHGYRWARTCLTGGAVASVAYSVNDLFSVDRPAAAAVAYAGTVIVGAVLICGGTYLLHRADAHEFFTR